MSIELVEEFHKAFGVPISDDCYAVTAHRQVLRLELLSEELEELVTAAEKGSVADILKEITDLQYVLDGTYLEFGLAPYKDAAYAEVHRSNMSKLGADGKPIFREDGKVLKGPAYSPADMSKVLDY